MFKIGPVYFHVSRVATDQCLITTVMKTENIAQYSDLTLISGSCKVDWRQCLDKSDGTLLNLEVTGTKSDCGVSVGLLSVRCVSYNCSFYFSSGNEICRYNWWSSPRTLCCILESRQKNRNQPVSI